MEKVAGAEGFSQQTPAARTVSEQVKKSQGKQTAFPEVCFGFDGGIYPAGSCVSSSQNGIFRKQDKKHASNNLSFL